MQQSDGETTTRRWPPTSSLSLTTAHHRWPNLGITELPKLYCCDFPRNVHCKLYVVIDVLRKYSETDLHVWHNVRRGTKNDKHPMGCEAQLAWKCLFTSTFGRRFWVDPWGRGLRQIDQIFVCNRGSLLGLCRQDYKSLCASVMICSTPDTHRHHSTGLYEKLS